MARNWAVCIGINHYVNMPELRCAKRDAEKMRDWFKEAGFELIYLFTDDSPKIDDASQPYASQPTFATLKRFFRVRFKPDTFKVEDNLWFFFSGHGLRHEGKDYLMPSDGDPHPEGVEETAIPLSYVTERLRGCGAGDVVIIYDACRDEVRAKGLGFGQEEQKGVITLASCSPQERSYEIDVPEIQQGSFTYALIEALENTQLGQGNYATFDRLYQRLRYRVPEINRQYGKPEKQRPYGFVQPDEKRYSILLPRQATTQDIETYKKQALNAALNDNLYEAERLLIRLWEISPGDPEVRQYYNKVILKKEKANQPSESNRSGEKLPTSPPIDEPVSQPEPARNKAYWLFQGNSKCHRLLDAIRDLEEMYWLVTRHKKNDIAVGDELLIWVSGKEAGIYALAEIIEPAKIKEEIPDIDYWIDKSLLDNKHKVRIRFTTKLLERPLLKENLKQDDILRDLSVIRNPRSSMFKVTPKQWKRVHELRTIIQSKKHKAYWLFQGNPQYYRMLDAIRDLEEMPWPLNRYKKDIAVGDEVLIWVSGKKSGIYAFGEIIEPVKILEKLSDIDYWIDPNIMSNLRTQPGPRIRLTTKLLEKPLLRKELKQDPILKNLSVIRINRGSVFKVTPEQWMRVHELKTTI